MRLKKRTFVLLGVMVVAVAAAIGAYAYFTATGSGTGSATVGSASNITLAGTVTGTLYPAGAAASVSVLVHNPGSGSQYVTNVHLDSITTDVAHAACDLSVSGINPAFTMADISVATTLTADDLAVGGTDQTTKVGSLQMNDTGIAQNSCQGAPLTLNLSSD